MFETARLAPNLRLLKQDIVGDIGKVLWVLMGTIGIVLLIACANVANLLLVRTEGRQQELAIRAALGAELGQIARDDDCSRASARRFGRRCRAGAGVWGGANAGRDGAGQSASAERNLRSMRRCWCLRWWCRCWRACCSA